MTMTLEPTATADALKVESQFPALFNIDPSSIPFSFSDVSDHIYVSEEFEYSELESIVDGLVFQHSADSTSSIGQIRSKVVSFLAKNGGEYVRDILGFTPHNFDGSGAFSLDVPGNYHSGDIVFGRIHTPSTPGFGASVALSQKNTQQAQFKIQIPFFNSSSTGAFETSISQELDIVERSVDLVIPATYKTIRWQNIEGDYFFTTELQNRGEFITLRTADNIYNGESGYEELCRQSGAVSHVNRHDYSLGSGPAISLIRDEVFSIDLNIPTLNELEIPGFEFHGKAVVQEGIEINYRINNEYSYVFFNALQQSTKRFEHYWSHKSTA